MNTFKRKSFAAPLLAAIGIVAVAIAGFVIPVAPAQAATPNYPPAYSIVPVVLHISGQYTATTAAVTKFNIPFRAKLIGVGASARVSGGTSPTLTVDVKAAGSTLLSAPITVTAATYTEGTITTAAVADEAAITVDLTITGTSPTWNDITVVMTFIRL